jgi:chitodextrinase
MIKVMTAALLVVCSVSFAQNINSLWKYSSITNSNSRSINKTDLPLKHLFDLDANTLKSALASTPKRETKTSSNTIISLPNGDGKLENFRVYENSVMDPGLAAKYPEIKSYVAVGIDNPSARAYFSNSPLGFKSMTLYDGEAAVFIEPISADLKTYTAYKKSDKKTVDSFECSATNQALNGNQKSKTNTTVARYAADDGKLRTLRLALASTAEYTAYFGGSKSLTLASMNNTMTRINGVFERDFGIKLVLVANNDALIYTNPLTDPYSDFSNKANWKTENQYNLDTIIGSSNYDIGHLLGAGSVNVGDAGGTGTICMDGNKGRAYTVAKLGAYQGDVFDISYVAHEMGHQLGADHTFTYKLDNNIAQLEPGSGSTIMSYGGLTAKDYQDHKEAYFHAISIQQVTDLIKTKSCPVVISTGNAVPVVNAGLDYTIPKGTPFMLSGSATDANTADLLSYAWEEMDLGTATTTVPTATNSVGPLFRSYTPSTFPTRYFPNMITVLAGLSTTPGLYIPSEVLPGVARTLNFRLTVRDNRPGGSANNTDDMIIYVDGNSGPFTVDSFNNGASFAAGTTETINWTVAGTNTNGVNCATVDILWSKDGGITFPITLLSATPNTGLATIVIPNIAGTANRIMVKGTNQIFFDVNNANFIITDSAVADTIAPTATTLSAAGTTTSGTNLSWTAATDNIGVSDYNIYQNGVLKTTTTATSLAVAGLTASTSYSFYVKTKDAAGNFSVASNTVNVSTNALSDTTAPTTSALSAAATTTSGTNLSWTTSTDNIGVNGYNVYQNGVLKTSITATSLAIDGLTASTTYSFYVKAKDAAGNLSLASNTQSITTLTSPKATAATYCSSYGSSTAREYINKVQIGTINNLSGNNNGYGDFSSLSTNLIIGSTNPFVITPAWSGAAVNEAYRIWIDFNQDGDFGDSGELVFSKSKVKTTTLSANLLIPTTALIGSTRMRIAMKYNALPNPCEIFSYGEVEDYTVSITSAATARIAGINEVNTLKTTTNKLETAQLSFKLYPNPVKEDMIYISDIDANYSYTVYNMMGAAVAKGLLESKEINVGQLARGVYILELNDGRITAAKRFIKE